MPARSPALTFPSQSPPAPAAWLFPVALHSPAETPQSLAFQTPPAFLAENLRPRPRRLLSYLQPRRALLARSTPGCSLSSISSDAHHTCQRQRQSRAAPP